MDLDPQDNKQTQPILAELASLSTQEADREAGIQKYESLLIKTADDYLELSIENFRHIKAKLPLAERLPKAPSLHEYSFLLPWRTQQRQKTSPRSQSWYPLAPFQRTTPLFSQLDTPF